MTGDLAKGNWATSAVPSPMNGPEPYSGIADWLGSGQFPPHGFCLFWDPNLVALIWLGNVAIAIAYFLIPMMLIYVVWKTGKKSVLPYWLVILFSTFILCCAISHIIEIVNLYWAFYWLDAIWLNVTGFVSLITAVLLPFGIHQAFRRATYLTVTKIIKDPSAHADLL